MKPIDQIQDSFPSLKEIRDYVEGNLNREDTYAFERQMESDPFLKDAVEGYQEIPAWSTAASLSKPKGSTSSKLIWISGAVIIIVGLAMWVFPESENTLAKLSPSLENDQISVERTVNEPNEIPDILESERTDSSISLTIQTLPEKQEVDADHFIQYRFPGDLSPIEPISVAESIDFKMTHPERILLHKFGTSGRIYHIEDYKVVDYRGQREENNPAFQVNVGTPASDGFGVLPKDDEFNDRATPYVDFLESSISKYSVGKYQKAKKNFDIILATFPDDINALFYGGMSAYSLGNYNEAIALYNECLIHEIRTFREEAKFYKALSLASLGEDEGGFLLKEISLSGGFYARQAQWHLEKL